MFVTCVPTTARPLNRAVFCEITQLSHLFIVSAPWNCRSFVFWVTLNKLCFGNHEEPIHYTITRIVSLIHFNVGFPGCRVWDNNAAVLKKPILSKVIHRWKLWGSGKVTSNIFYAKRAAPFWLAACQAAFECKLGKICLFNIELCITCFRMYQVCNIHVAIVLCLFPTWLLRSRMMMMLRARDTRAGTEAWKERDYSQTVSGHCTFQYILADSS